VGVGGGGGGGGGGVEVLGEIRINGGGLIGTRNRALWGSAMPTKGSVLIVTMIAGAMMLLLLVWLARAEKNLAPPPVVQLR